MPSRDPLAEIRQLYYTATRDTIVRDVARAIELLKSLPSEEARERATAYMHGLAEMRAQWACSPPSASARSKGPRRRPGTGRPTVPSRRHRR
jgi:hypothetical protein